MLHQQSTQILPSFRCHAVAPKGCSCPKCRPNLILGVLLGSFPRVLSVDYTMFPTANMIHFGSKHSRWRKHFAIQPNRAPCASDVSDKLLLYHNCGITTPPRPNASH